MKFLFVNLDWPGLVSKKTYKIHLALPPLDLVLLTGFARSAGHEAQIYDCFVEAVENQERVYRAAGEADYILIATTPYHMWQCPNSEWNWLKQAIAKFPAQKVILSGLHASVFPEQTLRETGVLAVIRREPETIFRDFLNRLDWRSCQGVSYLDGANYVENRLIELPSMDELTIQDYCVDITKYSYFLLGKNTGVFEASRGCPWKCTFCDQEMYSWKYRTKTPAVFAEEVSRALQATPMKTAYFFDLEFTVSRKRSIELCEELVKSRINEKLRWCCQTRADTIDEEVLDGLKAAGCVLIHFGVESANAPILKATNKKITVEKIERGVKLAKKKGFQTAGFFMFGLPREQPEEFENTLEFARSLNPTYASFHFAIPFPGTPLYQEYLAEKNLPWGVWPATFFDDWPHEQITAYMSRAYKRFYLFPKRFEVREFLFRAQNLRQKLEYFSKVN